MEYTLQQLVQYAIEIANMAGSSIMEFFEQRDFEQYSKADESPVTSADYAANEVVLAGLARVTPNTPILSEESDKKLLAEREGWRRYWLVDPLDGTQEFVAGRPDFAVNIALVENGKPVLGVIHAPVSGVTYYAVKGMGAYKVMADGTERLCIQSDYPMQGPLRVAISRVQTLTTITRYIKPDTNLEFVSLGSAALKSCLVAEGSADIYIRVGPTGEWDTGAPQVIVEEAGGQIVDSEFKPLTYNERESLINPDFMVLGDGAIDWHELIIPHVSRRD